MRRHIIGNSKCFMEENILFTELNDFVFCPASIYFHKIYGSMDKLLYQDETQINGTAAHESIDLGKYSTNSTMLMGTSVYCEKYRLSGKIDIYDIKSKTLRERKKRIIRVYDGYIFQLYAQYFSLIEMGYMVEKMELYSMDDHKTYKVQLPGDDMEMFEKFEQVIREINTFDMNSFSQDNIEKCRKCIYEPSCDRSLLC